MMTIVANPRNYKIPEWFLNRQKDHKTGKFMQVRGGGGPCCWQRLHGTRAGAGTSRGGGGVFNGTWARPPRALARVLPPCAGCWVLAAFCRPRLVMYSTMLSICTHIHSMIEYITRRGLQEAANP